MQMKERLDAAVVARGLVSGRDRAKGIIMAGQVYVDGQKADKPGQQVDEHSRIEIRGEQLPFVSRGGLKLEKAMETFGLSLAGMICADIGASTGGFTDCMLQKGAEKVYAIDVGYGQLAWKLRTDPRVVNLERTNIRYVTGEQIPEELDFLSIDVSFISLELVLPVAFRLLKPGSKMVCLVKPQFEAGREKVGKKGVVRDPAVHEDVIRKVLDTALSLGFSPQGLTFSPVKGPEGNIEYLLLLQREGPAPVVTGEDAGRVVAESHAQLDHNGGR
ncbi:MAG: TlyA family RNA methyltransferase [Angelakisella sp.]|nr:TlyA family RNA methyltransferase [Angelakisella sp.]